MHRGVGLRERPVSGVGRRGRTLGAEPGGAPAGMGREPGSSRRPASSIAARTRSRPRRPSGAGKPDPEPSCGSGRVDGHRRAIDADVDVVPGWRLPGEGLVGEPFGPLARTEPRARIEQRRPATARSPSAWRGRARELDVEPEHADARRAALRGPLARGARQRRRARPARTCRERAVARALLLDHARRTSGGRRPTPVATATTVSRATDIANPPSCRRRRDRRATRRAGSARTGGRPWRRCRRWHDIEVASEEEGPTVIGTHDAHDVVSPVVRQQRHARPFVLLDVAGIVGFHRESQPVHLLRDQPLAGMIPRRPRSARRPIAPGTRTPARRRPGSARSTAS